MEISPGLLQLIGIVFGFVFPFWPSLLLEAFFLGGQRVIKPMLATWLFFLASWLIIRVVPEPRIVRIIPEPWNTNLFFLTGLILVILLVFRRGEED